MADANDATCRFLKSRLHPHFRRGITFFRQEYVSTYLNAYNVIRVLNRSVIIEHYEYNNVSPKIYKQATKVYLYAR